MGILHCVEMQDYRKLSVWTKAHQFVLQMYQWTARFPESEKFGLVSQMRRSAISIPANIAEGCGRGSPLELRRYLHIASGSAHEVEYHVVLASDLGYLSPEACSEATQRITELKRMLSGLIQKL